MPEIVITKSQGERVALALGMNVTILPGMPLAPLFGDIMIEMAHRIAKLEARVKELEASE
jgi:hypothetical protein